MAESHNFLSADGHSQQHSEPANRSDHQSDRSRLATRASVRVVHWQVRDLKPHPSYARLGIKVPAARLNALLEMGEDAFLFPLVITSNGIVIDGYARLEVARLQGRATIECIEYNISEEEALRRLLLCHRSLEGLPAFCRVKLALPLAKSLKEKALQHQQNGGKNKGSSKLTEAQTIDVRKRIAAIVGISGGTLSHASDVLKKGDSEVLHALCNGEIKIYRAWRWCKATRACQRETLRVYRRRRGMERIAEKLVARQVRHLKLRSPRRTLWKNITPDQAISGLSALASQERSFMRVIFVRTPFPVLAVSEEIGRRLGFVEEVSSCSAEIP